MGFYPVLLVNLAGIGPEMTILGPDKLSAFAEHR